MARLFNGLFFLGFFFFFFSKEVVRGSSVPNILLKVAQDPLS